MPMAGTTPRVSRRGQVAVTRIDPEAGAGDLWIQDPLRGTIRLTSTQAYEWTPVWSPEGTRLAFGSNRSGMMNLYERGVGEAEPDRLLLATDKLKIPTDWSTDPPFLLFQESDPASGWDVWALPLSGERIAFRVLNSKFNERHGTLSPDGRWLAYSSDETGIDQVYVMPFAGNPSAGASRTVAGMKRSISTAGGSQPRWRADGKELFYLGADRKLVAVSITPGAALATGAVTPLFDTPVGQFNADTSNYDVAAEGGRFLILTHDLDEAQTPVTLILNWTRALKE
jgi:Tol biopolymer transport system component